jgi:regulator of cell morphogenesis and NO signaling
MSHQPDVFSPPGTPLLQRTVGELVAERPGRSRIFQNSGIDFCCQGGRTLQEACERKGIATSTLVEQLEAELADKTAPAQNPADLPADDLCQYIVETHHGYLRREFPRLHAMAERVAHVHGGHTPALVEVFGVFQGLEQELASHMMKEEQILFPAIAALGRGESVLLPLDGPIACMLHEHDDAGANLARLRELTGGFQPPSEACNTYRALFAGLAELEEDLHRHIHLENAVLFPVAKKLAAGIPAA